MKHEATHQNPNTQNAEPLPDKPPAGSDYGYEIHWGGFVFHFKTAEEARAAGFQI